MKYSLPDVGSPTCANAHSLGWCVDGNEDKVCLSYGTFHVRREDEIRLPRLQAIASNFDNFVKTRFVDW